MITMAKHEWRKHERKLYLPTSEPSALTLPALNFFTINGKGSPSNQEFADAVQSLYAVSYGVRMSHKKGTAPDDYFEYTVYPLEGVWDISEEAKQRNDDAISREDFVYTLMIRQPDFVNFQFAAETLEAVKKNKPLANLDQVRFETIEEGPCIQMLHVGPFANEPASFAKMEAYSAKQGLVRVDKTHREIYLSDPRKTAPEKLKTVLRFRIKEPA